MKVVIDCNVLISGGLSDGTCKQVITKVLAHHTNYLSDAIVREYRDVIHREKFVKYHKQLKQLLEVCCTLSVWHEGHIPISKYVLPDNYDKMYLDLALAVKVNYLITGNKKDFPKPYYDGVKIISPSEFLSMPS